MVPVVAAVLLIGTLIGALNGALTVLLRVHPLIVTIGMASVLQGAGLLYSLNPPGSVPPEFEGFAYGRVAGVPVAGAIMLGLFLAVGIFLRSTRLGRQIYAVGGDPFAARLIGIPHDKVIIVAYALSGLFAALTAVYLVSRLGIGDPWAGQGWALRSITPVVVGGTILAGGRGGVTGTLLGVFLISLLNNLLNYLDVSTYYQWIIQGLIIIVAVSVTSSGDGGHEDAVHHAEGRRRRAPEWRPAATSSSAMACSSSARLLIAFGALVSDNFPERQEHPGRADPGRAAWHRRGRPSLRAAGARLRSLGRVADGDRRGDRHGVQRHFEPHGAGDLSGRDRVLHRCRADQRLAGDQAQRVAVPRHARDDDRAPGLPFRLHRRRLRARCPTASASSAPAACSACRSTSWRCC